MDECLTWTDGPSLRCFEGEVGGGVWRTVGTETLNVHELCPRSKAEPVSLHPEYLESFIWTECGRNSGLWTRCVLQWVYSLCLNRAPCPPPQSFALSVRKASELCTATPDPPPPPSKQPCPQQLRLLQTPNGGGGHDAPDRRRLLASTTAQSRATRRYCIPTMKDPQFFDFDFLIF